MLCVKNFINNPLRCNIGEADVKRNKMSITKETTKKFTGREALLLLLLLFEQG